MIDLNKVGFEIVETVDGTLVRGGIILSSQCVISKLATYPEAVKSHAMNRVKEMIWEQAYGHLNLPLSNLKKLLCDPEMGHPSLKFEDASRFMRDLRGMVEKLEDSITGP